MASFFLLVAPLPASFRKQVIVFAQKTPFLGQVILTLKFTFFFIIILFVDSVNRVYRVQQEMHALHEAGSAGTGIINVDRSEIQARRFYAQRNMYLCGFTLFLSFILVQTYYLVLELADVKEKLAAVEGGKTSAAASEAAKAEVAKLKETIRKQDLDMEHLKKQAKGLSDEYNKVADELNEKSGVVPGDKKSD